MSKKVEKMSKEDIHLESSRCFKCGELFDQGTHKKTKHHAIPQCLKADRNVDIPIGLSCHQEINSMYVQTQKKARAPKDLKEFENKILGLIGANETYKKKLEKVYKEVHTEITKIEVEDERRKEAINEETKNTQS